MAETSKTYDYDEMWAEVYGDIQHFGPVHRHMHRIVESVLAGLDYSSVLDVGCGPGENYPLLSKGRSLTRFDGIDISESVLQKARAAVKGSFWLVDVQREHLDGVWDLVFSSLVFEHLPDDVAALHHLRPMTGKYLLLTTIAGNYERYRRWEEHVGHVRNFRRGELEQKLVAAGFKPRTSIYWGFPFYTPLVRTLHNLSTVGTGAYGRSTRLLASILYWVYFLNSHRRGDLLIVLAEV
jgi:SAM-dependent methyltransferase